MIRVCFVCLGNICRSPTAAGVMADLIQKKGFEKKIDIDSAGTGAWHVGERPDRRSRAAAKKRGIELPGQARQFKAQDFSNFDYVVAMDRQNFLDLKTIAPNATAVAKIFLLRSFDPGSPAQSDVPDPYYGGPRGFDDVLDICEAGCRGLLEHLVRGFQS